MRRCTAFLLFALAASPTAASDEVLVNMGIRPGTNRVTTMETEAQQTLNVVEDRGIVARSRANGRPLPFSVSMVQRQVVQWRSSPRGVAGDFTTRMRFLKNSTSVRDASGKEHELPEKNSIVGMEVRARLGADDKVDPASLEIDGATAEQEKLLKASLTAMFQQLQTAEPIRVRSDSPTNHIATVSIPIAELATIALEVSTVYVLRQVRAGVAEIDTKTSMTMTQDKSPLVLRASGFGSGSMTYNVDAQRVESLNSTSIMTFDLEMPDGRLRMQSNTTQRVGTTEQHGQ